jgi:hypothetical protein
MADFPVSGQHKPVISIAAPEALGVVMGAIGGFAGASALWPSANLAIFVPFATRSPYLVRKVWWVNGTAVNGTTDVGIYSVGGTRLVSSGATTQAGTSAIQSVTLGTPFLLAPGSYYMGMSASTGTTCQYFRMQPTLIQMQFMGMGQMASAHALPSTITIATVANLYQPLFGIANALVI